MALLAVAGASRAAQEPPRDADGPWSWLGSYGAARAAAQAERRPVLVYFPSPRAGRESSVALRLGSQLGRPAPVVGVQVSSEEILELKARFHVARLPAMLLVDRRENVAARWEGTLPQELAALVQGLARKLARREAEEQRILEEAERLAAAGDLEGAHRRGATLWRSTTAAPETMDGARRLEARLVDAQRRALRAALGTEGLETEEATLKRLEALRKRTPDEAVRTELDLEVHRLRATAIGGVRGGR